jgi:hypothetical protein
MWHETLWDPKDESGLILRNHGGKLFGSYSVVHSHSVLLILPKSVGVATRMLQN